ncbi:hypothetical protein DRO30_03985 [Candidatus Bathyarchaeota archaeon]|nr:MAG: hypothetical protein DRO30_03985 [Candidatus Bathyarchaeota archaeon]
MKANYLSKRESSEILTRLKTLKWGEALQKIRIKKNILRIEEEDIVLYKISKLLICERGRVLFPTLHEEYNQEILTLLPSLIVDMGAVPHIAKGADVMRPGIRKFEGKFRRGDLVAVRDEKNLKAIALALTLEDLEKCREMKRGKVAENIHHVNDRIWKLVQKIKHLLDRD